MSRWQFSVLAVVVLAVLSMVLGNIGGQMDCSKADELYNAGKYEEALTMYRVLLEENPDLPCAQEGVKNAEDTLRMEAEWLYLRGNAFEESGELELAREEYINALKKSPSLVDAQKGLNRVNQNEFAAVRTLAGLGLYTAAAELFEEIIAKIAETAGRLIALILIILLAAFAMYWRICPWIIDHLKHKSFLDIESFEGGAMKQAIGTGLAEEVEDEINKAMVQEGPLLVHLVDKPGEFEVPASIKSISPRIEIISELIEWAFPQKVIVLRGCLLMSKDRGIGLKLKLVNTQNGEIVDTCRLWESDYKGTNSCKLGNESKSNDGNQSNNETLMPSYRLTKPAANWTIFQLVEEEKGKILTTRLGTKDWQSFVYFGTGLRLETEGNKEDAQTMYERALNRDSSNRFALLKLGILKTEEAAEKIREKKVKKKEKKREYDYTLKLLKNAKYFAEKHEKNINWLRWMKNVAKSENEELVHGDDIWYNATYQVAATYTYRGDWSDADKTSKELLNAVQETKKALEKCESSMFHKFTKLFRWQVRDYFESAEKLKKRLDEIEPIIIIQRAIHLVGLGGKNISCAKALVDDLEKKLEDDGTELSYRSKYSLACYYSLLGESETKSEKTKTATYDNSLEYLKEALNQEGSIIHWAKIDPDLKGVYHGKRTEFAKLEEKYEFKASKQGTLMENEV